MSARRGRLEAHETAALPSPPRFHKQVSAWQRCLRSCQGALPLQEQALGSSAAALKARCPCWLQRAPGPAPAVTVRQLHEQGLPLDAQHLPPQCSPALPLAAAASQGKGSSGGGASAPGRSPPVDLRLGDKMPRRKGRSCPTRCLTTSSVSCAAALPRQGSMHNLSLCYKRARMVPAPGPVHDPGLSREQACRDALSAATGIRVTRPWAQQRSARGRALDPVDARLARRAAHGDGKHVARRQAGQAQRRQRGRRQAQCQLQRLARQHAAPERQLHACARAGKHTAATVVLAALKEVGSLTCLAVQPTADAPRRARTLTGPQRQQETHTL